MNRRMITPLTIAAIAALSLSRLAAQTTEEFLREAISGNAAEIELGRLAQERAENDAIRRFAAQLVDDHGEALDEAQELAEENAVVAPAVPTAEQQQAYDRLSQLSGQEFDRAFLSHMVEAHEMNIEKFHVQSQRGDSNVADWAEEKLPILEKHLEDAEQLQAQALQSRTER